MCTLTTYRHGCRCAECKAANAAYQREYQAQRNALGRPRPRKPRRRTVAEPEATWLHPSWLYARMKPQHPHAHRWRMASPNGPTVRGKCDCGRVRFDPASPRDGTDFNNRPAKKRRAAA